MNCDIEGFLSALLMKKIKFMLPATMLLISLIGTEALNQKQNNQSNNQPYSVETFVPTKNQNKEDNGL